MSEVEYIFVAVKAAPSSRTLWPVLEGRLHPPTLFVIWIFSNNPLPETAVSVLAVHELPPQEYTFLSGDACNADFAADEAARAEIAVALAATAAIAVEDETTALSAVLFPMIAAIAVEDDAIAAIAVEDDATAVMSA